MVQRDGSFVFVLLVILVVQIVEVVVAVWMMVGMAVLADLFVVVLCLPVVQRCLAVLN